jgi:hypothetical protein
MRTDLIELESQTLWLSPSGHLVRVPARMPSFWNDAATCIGEHRAFERFYGGVICDTCSEPHLIRCRDCGQKWFYSPQHGMGGTPGTAAIRGGGEEGVDHAAHGADLDAS